MGGAINISVGMDESDVSTDVLTNSARAAAALVADVAQHPLLPESELPRLKNDALRQLSISKSVPQSIALEKFRKLLYGDHPYGKVSRRRRVSTRRRCGYQYYEATAARRRAHL